MARDYSMTKALGLVRAQSIKNAAPVEAGKVINFASAVTEKSVTVKGANGEETIINADFIIGTVDGKKLSFPISELVNNFTFEDGTDILASAGDSATKVTLPAKLTVKEAKPRLSAGGEPVYSLVNMEGWEAVRNNEIDYNEFIKTAKPKAGASPMHSYVVTA